MGNHREKISFRQLWNDLLNYKWGWFRADLFAGLNVALLSIPQGMAYAMVAGLPVMAGLVTAAAAAIVAALFGSTRHLVVGPTNSIALIVGLGVSDVLYNNFRYVPVQDIVGITIQLTILVTIMAGVIQMVGGLFRLGQLAQLVSHSVATGYVTGVVMAVYVSQSFDLFGLASRPQGANMINKIYYLFDHFGAIHLPTIALGFGCVVLFVLLRRYLPSYCPGLIMLSFAAFVGWFLHLSEHGVALVADAGSVSFSAWRHPSFIFSFSLMNDLLPTAFAVALLSMLDATAVGKSVAAQSGQRLSGSQELLALGMANIACSFLGGMPSSASPARSIANFIYGAKTRMAAIFSGLFTLAISYLAGSFVEMVPIAALAALILVNASGLLDYKQFRLCLRATSSDRYVLLATIACCILFSLETAFYFGVGISVTLYLQQAAKPQLTPCQIRYRHSWRTGIFKNTEDLYRWIQVVQVNNPLFFGAADLFQDTLKAMTEKEAKVIVLVLRNTNTLDATACLALGQLHDYLSRSQRHLILCGVNEQVWNVLERSGLAEKLGRGNLFSLDNRPRRSVDYALERAVAVLEKNTSVTCQQSPLQDRCIIKGRFQPGLHEYIVT